MKILKPIIFAAAVAVAAQPATASASDTEDNALIESTMSILKFLAGSPDDTMENWTTWGRGFDCGRMVPRQTGTCYNVLPPLWMPRGEGGETAAIFKQCWDTENGSFCHWWCFSDEEDPTCLPFIAQCVGQNGSVEGDADAAACGKPNNE